MPVFRRPHVVAPRGHAPLASNRREELRYRPAIDQAQIGWWEGVSFRSANARILDISTGGAAIRVGTLPPMDRHIYFRLHDRKIPTESVSAAIVHAASLRPRGFELRLAFDVPCPPALFQATTCGFEALVVMLN